MITDPISDMLTRIRNASVVKKQNVVVPYSKIKFAIAEILKQEEYIADVIVEEGLNRKNVIKMRLKYNNHGPAIQSIKRISTPGRRVYKKAEELKAVLSGFGVAIISTSNGIMTNKEAKSRCLGGEIICEIF